MARRHHDPRDDAPPRRGQYRKDRLVDQFGADIKMPDLRHEIAQCPRQNAPGESCGVHYADAVPS
jgi:hypothetical protein